MKKVLVVYFSLSDMGSTSKVASIICNGVGGDLFRIVPKKDYPKDTDQLLLETKQEYKDAARPELVSYLDNISEYDVIFFCYPLWWNTLPMPFFTFIEHYDFTNKKIVPFCTNEGGGIGFSARELKEVCKGGNVMSGYAIKSGEVDSSAEQIVKWAIENLD